MDTKKISFGFSKITKKANLLPVKQSAPKEQQVELIKCLEGKEIKLVEEKPEEAPLVIPLKGSQKTSAALASLLKRRAVLLGEDEPQIDENTNTANSEHNGVAEDLEKRAARELLADLQVNGDTSAVSNLVLPVVKPDDLPLDGAKEATLNDYESIPIQQFGMAMLRGMGWVEPPKKKGGGTVGEDAPFVRPKGMGLGADKALKAKPLLIAPESNEVLEIKKQAYVRILGGKHKDLYGQIEGFDDHAGRVIVKMAIGSNKEAFNEFLCQPISKKEFVQYGKCINTAKYEEYKKMENEHGQIIINKEEQKPRVRKYSSDSNDYKHKGYKENTEKFTEFKDEHKTGNNKVKEEYYRKEKVDKSKYTHRSYNDDNKKSIRREENYSSSSRHREEDKEHRGHNYRNSKYIEERRSRSRERKDYSREHKSSSSRRRSSDQYSSDSSVTTDSKSEDSSDERKHKKKSSLKKKSKKSKSKSQHRSRQSDDEESNQRSSNSKKHKKKTKKSKKERSRSPTRSKR